MKSLKHYILIVCSSILVFSFAQTDVPARFQVSRDVAQFSKAFIDAMQEQEYELFLDRRVLKPAVIKEINGALELPIKSTRLDNEMRYLHFKKEEKLKTLRKVGMTQGIDWMTTNIVDLDERKTGSKGEIMITLASANQNYIIKLSEIETYTGNWKIGLDTDFQLVGTKWQVVQAKGIIKAIYLSLKSNDYTHIHNASIMSNEDMYELMDSSGQFKTEEGVILHNSRVNPNKVDKLYEEHMESAKKFRIKYIRGLTQSIQKYHMAGLESGLKWANAKVTKVNLELNLKERYRLGVSNLRFEFTDGNETYAVTIKDCFIINGQLRLGFKIKIELLEPEAILVRKMMTALTTNYFSSVLQSLVPGEELLKEFHKTDIRDILPRELPRDYIIGRVNILNELRVDFRQIILDGNLSAVQWPEVKLVDHNYGVQKTKIKKDLYIMSLTFDIEYKHLVYSIAIKKCILYKDEVYVLSDMSFLKIK